MRGSTPQNIVTKAVHATLSDDPPSLLVQKQMIHPATQDRSGITEITAPANAIEGGDPKAPNHTAKATAKYITAALKYANIAMRTAILLDSPIQNMLTKIFMMQKTNPFS